MSTTRPSSATAPNRTGQIQYDFHEVIGRRILHVARAELITPRYRRIALTGHDLAGGFPFRQFAATDHVKLFFPDPETGELVMPTITENGWEYPDGAGDPIYRDYTVRAYNPDANDSKGEVVVDFVVHDHGVAGVWARDAKPGAEVGVLGPRAHILLPQDYSRYLVAGDETALPAISRIIEEAPTGARITAVIEVADAGEEQALTGVADIDIRWVHRDTAPVAEGHLSPLETAVRRTDVGPDDEVFAFIAGEATALKPIRRYLRRELGFRKEQVDVDGYWKKGTANLDHHSDELAEDED